MGLNRDVISRAIAARLLDERVKADAQWCSSAPINHFWIDGLLPEEWCTQMRRAFPSAREMRLRRSLRELKYVSAQMNECAPLLEEAVFAFQAPEVIDLIQQITRLRALEPDALLYAGGISMMGPGHFLNPHVDNSHDKFRERYRVLNLLYYVSPDWTEENGGNLELWPHGPAGEPRTIVSKFNRLVVMVTHTASWHSVSRNRSAEHRCCISNYYFSRLPVGETEYFHVTSFRGRPEQRVRDVALRTEGMMRTVLRKVFPKGVRESSHYYKKGAGRGGQR